MQVIYGNNVIAEKLIVANTFIRKLFGLMFKNKIEGNVALVLYNSKQIHTFFMRFPIDVFFLDKNKKIIKIYKNFKPWKISGYFPNSKYILETKSGVAENFLIEEGSTLEFKNNGRNK